VSGYWWATLGIGVLTTLVVIVVIAGAACYDKHRSRRGK